MFGDLSGLIRALETLLIVSFKSEFVVLDKIKILYLKQRVKFSQRIIILIEVCIL